MELLVIILGLAIGGGYYGWQFFKRNFSSVVFGLQMMLIICGPLLLIGLISLALDEPMIRGVAGIILLPFLLYQLYRIIKDEITGEADIKRAKAINDIMYGEPEIWEQVDKLPPPTEEELNQILLDMGIYPYIKYNMDIKKEYHKKAMERWRIMRYNELLRKKHKFVIWR